MNKKEKKGEWSGVKGSLFAWHLDNPVVRLVETLFLGNPMPAFLNEISGIVKGNEHILDIGAGTGRFSLPMAKRLSTGKVICLDISEVMLEYLSRKAEKLCLRNRIQILNADASSTGLDDESMDIAISNNVFHELSSPDTVLSEMNRVLKTGGHVIITDFRDTFIGRIVSHHGKNAHGPFKTSELASILARKGFTDLKVSPIRGFLIGIARKQMGDRMMTEDLYKEIKRRMRDLLIGNDLLDQKVRIHARALTSEEAIGNPEADDFPLQKGRERLMQADFQGTFGQAYTDQYGDFEGPLKEILEIDLKNNYRQAIFIATLNAVLRHMGLIEKTVHCKDQGPSECADALKDYIKDHYGAKKVLQIGFQPRMVESLAKYFQLRIIDLDPENIGAQKFGVHIEGPDATDEAKRWADLLLVTGTTLVNDTIGQFLHGKPVIFYGTTIAGAAYLMGWERFCAFGS